MNSVNYLILVAIVVVVLGGGVIWFGKVAEGWQKIRAAFLPTVRRGVGKLQRRDEAAPLAPTAASTDGEGEPSGQIEHGQHERIFIADSPEDIVTSFRKNQTAIQVTHEAELKYVGKWVKWRLPVSDVERVGDVILVKFAPERSPLSRQVSFIGWQVSFIVRIEDEQKVTHLKVGDYVNLEGRIKSAAQFTISLTDVNFFGY